MKDKILGSILIAIPLCIILGMHIDSLGWSAAFLMWAGAICGTACIGYGVFLVSGGNND